jgi:hypothetical protein
MTPDTERLRSNGILGVASGCRRRHSRSSSMANANAGAASVSEPPIGIVIGEQQGPEKGPRSLGIRPPDQDELLAVQAFQFQPQTAAAGGIGRIGPLRIDPFELQPAGLLIEGLVASGLMIAELKRRVLRPTAARGAVPSAP